MPYSLLMICPVGQDGDGVEDCDDVEDCDGVEAKW